MVSPIRKRVVISSTGTHTVPLLGRKGGFEALPYSDVDKYPSELADGGRVGWKRFNKNADGAVGPITYPAIRWEFNQKPFGWSILQHIVYLRSTLTIQESSFYVVSFANVMSFKIDDHAFVGNLRGNHFPAPSIVYLRTGDHKVYTTVIMDVRSNGGY
jgi:hypothetical protein